jgi:hypothetical protein
MNLTELGLTPTQHAETQKLRSGYWYKHYITECPICGRGHHYRERQYTPAPPKNSPQRWDYDMVYDYCDAL